MTQLLRMISTNDITMLKDINNLITINKTGQFKFCYIPSLEIVGLINFISKLEKDSIYTVIPVISMFGKENDPQIILSKQILVFNNSSSKLIHDYLNYKLDRAIIDFGINNLDNGKYFQFKQTLTP
jgi:hypothetical protein